MPARNAIGRHILVTSALWLVVCPLGRADTISRLSTPAAGEAARRVDAALARSLGKLPKSPKTSEVSSEVSGLVDDATFLRRVSLDLAGVLPAAKELREF